MDRDRSGGWNNVKPAQSIDSRIFLFFFLPFVDTIRHVAVSIIGTSAALSSLAMLFTFSAATEQRLIGTKRRKQFVWDRSVTL